MDDDIMKLVEEALGKLDSEYNKAVAISRLVGVQFPISPERVAFARKYFEENSCYWEGGILEAYLGNQEDARRLFRQEINKSLHLRMFERAAIYAEQIGEAKLSQRIYRKAAEKNERDELWGSAAPFYLKAGKLEKAMMMAERGGIYDFAEEMAFVLGKEEKLKVYTVLADLLAPPQIVVVGAPSSAPLKGETDPSQRN